MEIFKSKLECEHCSSTKSVFRFRLTPNSTVNYLCKNCIFSMCKLIENYDRQIPLKDDE